MPGKNYIKVTSILLLISAIICIIIYPIAGLFFDYATIKTGESLGWIFVAICVLYTIVAILELIASIKGIKGCNDKSACASLKTWGTIVLVIAVISAIFNFVTAMMGGDSILSSVISFLVSLILPGLYLYGVSLNQNA